MNIKKSIQSNKIIDISIDNSFIKIKDNFEEKNEFSITEIQKIYLKSNKSNLHLIYCGLITILTILIIPAISFKLVIGLLILFIITVLIIKFSLDQKKYSLHIKLFENNKTYSIGFTTKRKDEILNIIWQIRKCQFENQII